MVKSWDAFLANAGDATPGSNSFRNERLLLRSQLGCGEQVEIAASPAQHVGIGPAHHFIPTPWGRAGPVENAVLKSTTRNAGSTVRLCSRTSSTRTLWSPSKWTFPKSS